jgi:outer membrane protein
MKSHSLLSRVLNSGAIALFRVACPIRRRLYCWVWNTPAEPIGERNQVSANRKLARGFEKIGATFNKENKVNSRNYLRTAALAAACFLGTAAVQAQGAPAAGSAASGKVGVVDVRSAIVTTAEGKQASAELQSKFAPRQTELENMNKQINDIRQRLQAGASTLSPEAQATLQRQGEVLARQLERKQTEYQEDVNAEQGEVIDRIGRKMIDVLDRYARENGFVAVFDSSAQNSNLIYKSNQIDVTQEIIRLYDQAYPLKAGSTTPAKPAAKPATPPATKPQQ